MVRAGLFPCIHRLGERQLGLTGLADVRFGSEADARLMAALGRKLPLADDQSEPLEPLVFLRLQSRKTATITTTQSMPANGKIRIGRTRNRAAIMMPAAMTAATARTTASLKGILASPMTCT
jgi:hypothetical protein